MVKWLCKCQTKILEHQICQVYTLFLESNLVTIRTSTNECQHKRSGWKALISCWKKILLSPGRKAQLWPDVNIISNCFFFVLCFLLSFTLFSCQIEPNLEHSETQKPNVVMISEKIDSTKMMTSCKVRYQTKNGNSKKLVFVQCINFIWLLMQEQFLLSKIG